ncbi:MAG: 6-phosphofructokinase, partial [Candidatus Neomarinimicrobiota bacterium]
AAGLAVVGVATVGVPKTIDNDLSATDYTFGFDTAVARATDAIDRLHTTARSHHRALVVEVMGRQAGWIALHAGIAGGADYTMLPEEATDSADLCASVRNEYGDGRKNYAVVVVSEGAQLTNMPEQVLQDESRDAFGNVKLGGIGHTVARVIEQETGIETRSVVLGHTQRGGPPTARDRVLSTRYGHFAAQMIHDGAFGQMAALQGDAIVAVPLAEATTGTKVVGEDWISLLELLKA